MDTLVKQIIEIVRDSLVGDIPPNDKIEDLITEHVDKEKERLLLEFNKSSVF